MRFLARVLKDYCWKQEPTFAGYIEESISTSNSIR